jgi:hypothetical protein
MNASLKFLRSTYPLAASLLFPASSQEAQVTLPGAIFTQKITMMIFAHVVL